LLDIQTEQQRYLNINEALKELLKTEVAGKPKTVTMDTLAVGVARAGSENPMVKAAFVKDLLNHDFGQPPFSLIFPGKLHFMEAEALIVLAGAPEAIRREVE
jgi:diphthine synthase